VRLGAFLASGSSSCFDATRFFTIGDEGRDPPLHQAVEEEEQEPPDKEKYLLLKQLYAYTMPCKPG
jgi:hypothetical protein